MWKGGYTMDILFITFITLSLIFLTILDLFTYFKLREKVEELEHCRTLYGITIQTLIDDVLDLKDKIMED